MINTEFEEYGEDPFEQSERLFDATEYERSGGGGDCHSFSSSARNHDEGLRAVPDGTGPHGPNGSDVPGEQLELDLGIPTEQEAHAMWIATTGDNSLMGIANKVMKAARIRFQDADMDDIKAGLLYEGTLALKAWKSDRGRSLKNYVYDRMKRRLPRLISQSQTNDIRSGASINQLQKFDAITRHWELHDYEDMLEEWVHSGEDPDLFRWLMQDHFSADSPVNEDCDIYEDQWSRIITDARPAAAQGITCGEFEHMTDEQIWDYLFEGETLPLWTQHLDADDFRVLQQRRANPDASAREIGRVLGHDKNWVIRRDNKIKEALKGFTP